MDKYDISGYCQTVYSPPYSCTKEVDKSVMAILSLSFASSQLVFTILIILVSCGFKTFSKPVHQSGDDEGGEKMMEMHQGITANPSNQE